MIMRIMIVVVMMIMMFILFNMFFILFILSIEGFGYDSQIKLFDEMKKMKDMTKSDENQSNAKSKLVINSTNSNLFLVCYHLPITIKRTGK